VVVADLALQPRVDGAKWIGVDITQPDQIWQAFEETQPDAVVNVAALADIDRVERDRELAWKINVDGAHRIAQYCARLDCAHVFFSSDAVFDGVHGPYAEDDLPNPVNFYGITKADAEQAVLSAYPEAAVIRISLVLGLPQTVGNSFLAGLKDKLQAGKEVICPVDEIRTPVDVHTLSACVLELLRIDYAGRLHIGCTESIDRYSLTQRLAQEMGYSRDLVKPQAEQQEPAGRAPRHKKGVLDVSKARQVLKTRLLTLEETIHKAVL
jgi:dTDP-4-dehydrorhamnose reductase